ncbi:MAG TPA: GNAT family N-acetyltransferase, partial [Longimicrobium sp.]|nr:GNAT family N-acetyltransferase [Longimicrobium sp.]
MEIVAASTLMLSELTRLWNAGYTDYFVPIQLDEARMRRHLACGPVDLSRSLVVMDGGTPVAFSFLATRGERGWIGRFGVAPSHRGRGIAYTLFE